MWAICTTDDCGNYGIPINIGPMSYVDEETGETVAIDGAACGVCGQPIAGLSDTEPEPLVDLEEELTDG